VVLGNDLQAPPLVRRQLLVTVGLLVAGAGASLNAAAQELRILESCTSDAYLFNAKA
jgi:hypothetical protein